MLRLHHAEFRRFKTTIGKKYFETTNVRSSRPDSTQGVPSNLYPPSSSDTLHNHLDDWYFLRKGSFDRTGDLRLFGSYYLLDRNHGHQSTRQQVQVVDAKQTCVSHPLDQCDIFGLN